MGGGFAMGWAWWCEDNGRRDQSIDEKIDQSGTRPVYGLDMKRQYTLPKIPIQSVLQSVAPPPQDV